MEAQARREYAKEMRSRYLKADRPERGRLLDEFTLVTGYHRKYAIALLIREPGARSRPPGKSTRFTEECTSALVSIWRAADYPWSVRLAALLPLWMPYARERLDLTVDTEQLLLGMSASRSRAAMTSEFSVKQALQNAAAAAAPVRTNAAR